MKQHQPFVANHSKIVFRYYLFVNTASGNKEGKLYLELSESKITYIYPPSTKSIIEVVDMFNTSRRDSAFKAIRSILETNPDDEVRIIICGGDGTIPWVLGCVLQASIPFDKITIGILPIGTGNDFSRSIGWGYKTSKFNTFNLVPLHRLVAQWNKAQIDNYDVWDIQIETYPQGGLFQIKNQTEIRMESNKLKRTFTNYFGIGLDGRVVYGVEKQRGSNAIINKILYALIGVRNLFTSIQDLADIVEYFMDFSSQSLQEAEGNGRIVPISKGIKGLSCLNCTSYMCGLRNVWMTDKTEQIWLKNKDRQKYNDGKIQFVGYKNELGLALERIIRSGSRVNQGTGPFQIKFKQIHGLVTYMEIDGESVKVEEIKKIKVKRSTIYSQGSLRILIQKSQN